MEDEIGQHQVAKELEKQRIEAETRMVPGFATHGDPQQCMCCDCSSKGRSYSISIFKRLVMHGPVDAIHIICNDWMASALYLLWFYGDRFISQQLFHTCWLRNSWGGSVPYLLRRYLWSVRVSSVQFSFIFASCSVLTYCSTMASQSSDVGTSQPSPGAVAAALLPQEDSLMSPHSDPEVDLGLSASQQDGQFFATPSQAAVSPSLYDESIGAVSPSTFQRLADGVLDLSTVSKPA